VAEPSETIERLHAALNAHDIEAFCDCFDAEYRSEQPNHPDRAFQGRDQVRKNWTAIFDSMPDLQATRLSMFADGNMVCVEWRWTANQGSSEAFDWRGMCVFGVDNDRITWGRLYMGPVDTTGHGIDATVDDMTSAPERTG
jgi:hypothetical protein